MHPCQSYIVQHVLTQRAVCSKKTAVALQSCIACFSHISSGRTIELGIVSMVEPLCQYLLLHVDIGNKALCNFPMQLASRSILGPRNGQRHITIAFQSESAFNANDLLMYCTRHTPHVSKKKSTSLTHVLFCIIPNSNLMQVRVNRCSVGHRQSQ